jgi:hypothetical protein
MLHCKKLRVSACSFSPAQPTACDGHSEAAKLQSLMESQIHTRSIRPRRLGHHRRRSPTAGYWDHHHDPIMVFLSFSFWKRTNEHTLLAKLLPSQQRGGADLCCSNEEKRLILREGYAMK